MASSFPGMDPYLEARSLWSDVHLSLISYIREAIQPQVRPKYIARIGERIEVASIDRGYLPDGLIGQPPRKPAPTIGQTGILVADEPTTFTFLEEERHVPYLEIVYRETGDVVTVIEVLSPANKQGEGREHYLQKQTDLLSTHSNLVEIDLLGEGRTTTLARTAVIRNPPDWRYVVSVSRGRSRRRVEVYAFGIKERLPRCRIPLRSADPDVVLDLPAVFTRCYEVGGYDLLIDYRADPPVTLPPAEAAWLHAHLQTQGIRHSHQ